jgi:L-fucose mutarotase
MLKNIPSILSPELLMTLMEMGHGDEILIADGNYPASGCAEIVVRLDGHGVPEILEAILKFLPLDTYVKSPASLMAVNKDDDVATPIWDVYKEKLVASGEKFKDFEYLGRDTFYERAKKAYATITTGEAALYANIILKKGVVIEN